MKTNHESLFIGACLGLLLGTLISVMILYETTEKQREYDDDMGPVIIWNEDDEGVPAEGSLLELEMIKNDTLYIKNVE